jgi:hypothetical protein
MAALNENDLILVQQGTANDTLRKATLRQLEDWISSEIQSEGSINLRGTVDLTQPYGGGSTPPNQLFISPPLNGDLYINEGTGPIDYTGLNPWVIKGSPVECENGQRVIWSESDNAWLLVGADAGGGTLTDVTATNGIEVIDNGDPAVVALQGVDATTTDVGVVTLSDHTAINADGQYDSPSNNVLTEYHYNQLVLELETEEGTDTISGTVKLTDDPVYNDTRGVSANTAVTPAGLVANWIPKIWTDIPSI